MSDNTPTKLAVVPTPPSSSDAPSSPTSSRPSSLASASTVTLLTSAGLSGFVAWRLFEMFPRLIEAKAWTQFYVALAALCVAVAPASFIPLLNRVMDRVLGPRS